jgi:hypothetical protein
MKRKSEADKLREEFYRVLNMIGARMFARMRLSQQIFGPAMRAMERDRAAQRGAVPPPTVK